jgi:hypothetical protein
MSDVVVQIAREATELAQELRVLLQAGEGTPCLSSDDIETLPHLFAERFPDMSDERAELKGLLKIGRAARRSENLSPAVAAAALAMTAEFRTTIARLGNRLHMA